MDAMDQLKRPHDPSHRAGQITSHLRSEHWLRRARLEVVDMVVEPRGPLEEATFSPLS